MLMQLIARIQYDDDEQEKSVLAQHSTLHTFRHIAKWKLNCHMREGESEDENCENWI